MRACCRAAWPGCLLVVLALHAGMGRAEKKQPTKAEIKVAKDLVDSSMAGDVAKVAAAIDAGAEVDGTDMYGWTSLLRCSAKGHAACVTYLIEQGAIVDNMHENDRTPLMYAVSAGHPEAVQALLDAGADPDKPDAARQSAMDHCKESPAPAEVREEIQTILLGGQQKMKERRYIAEKASVEVQLTNLFTAFNPEKLPTIPDLMVKYEGRWAVLLKAAREKYKEQRAQYTETTVTHVTEDKEAEAEAEEGKEEL